MGTIQNATQITSAPESLDQRSSGSATSVVTASMQQKRESPY
jgi:hypothetical protein